MLIATLLFLVVVLFAVSTATKALQGATIRTASWWAFVGVASWLAITIAALFDSGDAGWLDAAHYAVAVVLLCPLIAVLGARRPSANVWNVFVLVPMILVLMWPVVASADVLKGRQLELESPTMVAFALVLVMGAGNYFGTLCGFPAFVFACCQVCLVLPLWSEVPEFFFSKTTARLVASIAIAWSVLLVKVRRTANSNWDGPPLTKLWLDFIDMYGMVWGKRVMDRVNEAAIHEKWDCRLELDGFATLDQERSTTNPPTSSNNEQSLPTPPSADSLRKAEPIIRWLMKRFVNEDWVTKRIGAPDPDLPSLGPTGSDSRRDSDNPQ
jgi:hypothetical protein